MCVEAEPNLHEEMIPITIEKPEDALTVQRFVAIPGKAFHCRVELSKAPPEGQLWGCRVYVDKGCNHRLEAYDVTKGAEIEPSCSKRMDQSEPDHFFWFGPGETSYTVRGFYCSSAEEYGFKFGELSRSAARYNPDQETVEDIQGRIGIIRFQFARVKRMEPRTDRGRYHNVPSLSKDYMDGLLKRKGSHICTDVGKRIKTGSPSENVAKLETDIAYESRVVFNDLAGYKAQKEFHVYHEPTRLRALPLAEFNTTRPKRKFFIELFLTWLQNNRYTIVDESIHPAPPAPNGVEGPTLNLTVGTEDLVHFINATLSPTAAFIVCTGREVPGNFHVREKLVQMRRVTAAQRDAFFAEKEDGLVSFLASDPNNYELSANGVDAKGRVLYDVKKSPVIVIEDSDSD